MLPASYQLPAAIVLLVGGIVACFFGYRLFRIVLAIFGFMLGALAASSIFGMSDTGPMLVAAAVGGLIGAAILIAAYFVGVALVGAGAWRGRRQPRVRGRRSRSALPGRRLPARSPARRRRCTCSATSSSSAPASAARGR